MIVIDTDVLSHLEMAAKNEGDSLVSRLRALGNEVCVTIVSFEEQFRGWMAYVAKPENRHRLVLAYARMFDLITDFSLIRVLMFDSESEFHLKRLMDAKVRISTMDLRIAAITIAHNATLLTRNTKDFKKVPGLRLEDIPTP